MKTNAFAAAAAFVVLGMGATEQSAHAQTAPEGMGGLTRGAFQKPNAAKPSGSTVFTPESADNLFINQIEASPQIDASKKGALKQYAVQINQMVESAYQSYGFSKNDLGVALGALLETTWEIANGSFRVGGNETAEEKAKTLAAVHQIQNALLSAPAYKTLPNKNKQMAYEAATFISGNLATEWVQAGSDATKKAKVQAEAKQQLQTMFGVGARSLTRRPDGTFASTSASSASANAGAAKSGSAAKTPAASAATKPSGGPLPAASIHGAQIFVKYVFQGTSTSLDQLILFPDGAAFSDLPPKPVASFDEATLKASVKPFYVGTWKKSGSTLTLSFPNATRDKVVVLHKVPKGWYDGSPVKTDDSYNTYFPVRLLTPQSLAGAWKTQSLTTMGMAGGAAPMVAAGSSGTRVYNANGTFSGGSKSFASATTQNPDTGNVGVYGKNQKNGAGRWRLDGPLLTMEEGGRRTVTTAFILPNWKKNGPPDVLIDGDWWKRPEKE